MITMMKRKKAMREDKTKMPGLIIARMAIKVPNKGKKMHIDKKAMMRITQKSRRLSMRRIAAIFATGFATVVAGGLLDGSVDGLVCYGLLSEYQREAINEESVKSYTFQTS
jgi:hypothetical protein